jgi:Peptidase A4 family
MALLARPGIPAGLLCWLVAALMWLSNPPHTTHALAQPIPVPAATNNPYWGGYVTTQYGSFSSVRASWIVPRAPCSVTSLPSTSYVWIGEGGYVRGLASPLIQAGTASDCFGGVVRYHAFYEWYPGIYATDFPISVKAGDSVTALVKEQQPGFWLLSVRDNSTAAQSSTTASFTADTSSADFIVERPTLCNLGGCQQAQLGRFGTLTFQDVHVTGSRGLTSNDLRSAVAIALIDPDTSRVLAVPGRVPSTAGTLSVIWRGS